MLRLTWKILRKSRFRAPGFPRSAPSSRSERGGSRDRGAALITVLLFVVLMFILITAMLTVTGNEIVIAGLQKDGMRATELAQAGIQEAIARVAIGRPYSGAGGWPSSLDPRWSTTPNPPCPSTADSVWRCIFANVLPVQGLSKQLLRRASQPHLHGLSAQQGQPRRRGSLLHTHRSGAQRLCGGQPGQQRCGEVVSGNPGDHAGDEYAGTGHLGVSD